MPQTPRVRTQRSRLGLTIFLIVLLDLALEVLVFFGAPLPFPTAGQIIVRGLGGGGGTVLEGIAFEPLPYVSYGLTPDYERQRSSSDAPLKTTNSHGFRGPEISRGKSDGTYRIVCLGGSTTYSDAVNDDETYPLHLEAILRERRPGRPIEVINAGVPSYTSAESLANLAFRCLEFEPDMIVVYHAANDVRPRRYANFEPTYFHYRKVWDGSDRLRQTGEGDMAGGMNPYIQWLPPDDNGDPVANLGRNGSGAFRRNLVSIVGIARAHGIEPVLTTFAAKGPDPVTDPGLIQGIEEHNAAIRAVAAEHDVTLVDVDGNLSREGTFAQAFGQPDPVHLTPKGTREKAQIIADGVLGLIP
jgi:lysophospholipase L1-like esterase